MNSKDSNKICHYLFVLEALAQSDQTSTWVNHNRNTKAVNNLTHTEFSTVQL